MTMQWRFLAERPDLRETQETFDWTQHDPYVLPDMAIAVERISRAIKDGERILIYGDYDVDGIAGAALLYHQLQAESARVAVYIPDRSLGYGLNLAALPSESVQPQLIITVDNGVNAILEIARCAARRIDVIVVDHHPLEGGWPGCTAVIHPGRLGTPEHLRHLSGAGVAWMLASALSSRTLLPDDAGDLLDLAALGTIADVVPLQGINRAIVSRGLCNLNSCSRAGVEALLRAGNVSGPIKASTIAMQIAPRLNAAGRLAHGQLAAELLMSTCPDRTFHLATVLEQLNLERRRLVTEGLADIEEDDRPDSHVHHGRWHAGIIGVLAGRLAEERRRPQVVITSADGVARGSARAPAGFDLLEALQRCSSALVRWGGHRAAAALVMREDKVKQFRELFDQAAAEWTTPEATLDIAGTVKLREVDPELLDRLERLEPFGVGNSEPVFASGPVQVLEAREVRGGHRRLSLFQEGRTLGAIWFGGASAELRPWMEVAYHPRWNEWRGQRSMELQIVDARPA